MANLCDQCGQEIAFRHIGGRVVPLGCRCKSDTKTNEPSLRDQTYCTACPKCGCAVYFIRYNGGCVWVDELGIPWPKHECFLDNEKGIAEIFPSISTSCVGTVSDILKPDWKGRTVLNVSCTSYLGRVVIMSSNKKTLKKGDIISLGGEEYPLWFTKEQIQLMPTPQAYLLMHTEGGDQYEINTETRVCQHCSKVFVRIEYDDHLAQCMSESNVICGICNQTVHWTDAAAHRRRHQLEGDGGWGNPSSSAQA
jgi:hypothetical protein